MNQVEYVTIRKKIFDAITVNRGKGAIAANVLSKIEGEKERKLGVFKDIKMSDKSEIERGLLLEQYNYVLLQKQIEIKKCEDFNKRAVAFLNYVVALSTEGNLEEATKQLSICVYDELRNNYDSEINLLRQKRLIFKKQSKYLTYIKTENPEEYKRKIQDAISSDEIANDAITQYDLEEERDLTSNISIKNDTEINIDSVKSMALLDKNILGVAKNIFPNFKDKILEHNEKNVKGVK